MSVIIFVDDDEIIVKINNQRGQYFNYSNEQFEALKNEYPQADIRDKRKNITQNITGSNNIVTGSGNITIQ